MLFQYKAIDKDGKTISGEISASDKDSAVRELNASGIVISSITGGLQKERRINIFARRVTTKDIYILANQMSTLFAASIPAHRALNLVTTQTENPTLRGILYEISDDVKKGIPISEAFDKHPQFSKFFVSMLAVGEESGSFSKILKILADYHERIHELTTKVRGALTYPIFVLITFFLVLWFLLSIIIPQIVEVLLESGGELPLITQFVIGLSNFVAHNSLLIFLVIFTVGFLTYKYATTKNGGAFFDTLKLKLPLIGKLYTAVYIARISSMLGLMLSNGVRLLRATEVVVDVSDNYVYSAIFDDATKKLKAGVPLSSVFIEHEEFIPSLFAQMTKVGEETGQLGNMLSTVSDFFERETKNTIDVMIKLIEPILILFLGVTVSVFLASVLLPIYNLSGQL